MLSFKPFQTQQVNTTLLWLTDLTCALTFAPWPLWCEPLHHRSKFISWIICYSRISHLPVQLLIAWGEKKWCSGISSHWVAVRTGSWILLLLTDKHIPEMFSSKLNPGIVKPVTSTFGPDPAGIHTRLLLVTVGWGGGGERRGRWLTLSDR